MYIRVGKMFPYEKVYNNMYTFIIMKELTNNTEVNLAIHIIVKLSEIMLVIINFRLLDYM